MKKRIRNLKIFNAVCIIISLVLLTSAVDQETLAKTFLMILTGLSAAGLGSLGLMILEGVE